MSDDKQMTFDFVKDKQIVNAKDPAVKYDRDKERYDLVPADALNEIVKVYTYGAKKYGEDRNWEKGLSWGRVFGALMRHSWAFWRGKDTDDESGLPHLAHAGWCVLTLLAYMKTHKEFDDRSKRISI